MTILLTSVAMMAFAANSLLARLALAGDAIDAASFTAIRLASGALVLLALLWRRNGRGVIRDLPGSWPSALFLFVYAMAFTLAYLRLGAATGALILFAAVQGTMILWGVARRDRPTTPEIVGLAVASGALIYLLLPGLDTPDRLGSLLMMAAGAAWGIYSLRGRGARHPLGETAGNFLRSALLCVPVAFLAVLGGHATPSGIGLAATSGVVASGLGYAVWYRALPDLSTAQAAVVQLTVPVIAAIGAAIFLSEALTPRLLIAGLCILGGVALALLAPKPAEGRCA